MKIALTGGPSGGKTTLASLIQKEFSEQVVVVPEAASILFGGGFPRRPGIKSLQHRQKAIYFVQRELEGIIREEFPKTLLVCDRGSLDGIAYWPTAETDFLVAIGSTLEAELARYDWVIHLDTAPQAHYDISNPLRTESYQEAKQLNERVKTAWAKHPRRFVIANGGHFVDKMARALSVVHGILAGNDFTQISAHLAQTAPRTLMPDAATLAQQDGRKTKR